MFYGNYYWGMNLIWWFAWIILLFWIFAVPYEVPGQRNRKNGPLDILQRRLASGHITNEEYQAKKKILDNELPVQDRL